MTIITYSTRKNLSFEDVLVITTDFEVNSLTRSKKLISFCIILLHLIDGKFVASIQIDSAHGSVHAHRFYKSSEFVEPLCEYCILKETIILFCEDFSLNWKSYRKWLLQRKDL